MNSRYNILFIIVLSLFSCTKVEGEGGTTSIVGRVIINDYNGNGEFQGSYNGADEDVFIIYGAENTAVSDKVITSYDGSYRFDYLQSGTYKVFGYSDCDSCLSGQVEVLKTIEISANKQEVVVEDIVLNR